MCLRKNLFARVTAANIQMTFNHVKCNQTVTKIENVCYLLCIQVFMFVYMYERNTYIFENVYKCFKLITKFKKTPFSSCPDTFPSSDCICFH